MSPRNKVRGRLVKRYPPFEFYVDEEGLYTLAVDEPEFGKGLKLDDLQALRIYLGDLISIERLRLEGNRYDDHGQGKA